MVAARAGRPAPPAGPWPRWLDEVHAQALGRGAHLARTVVLLPYTHLLPVASAAWAERFAGYMPRFQTTRSWAAEAGAFIAGARDLCFDHARDLLTARELLAHAGLGAQAPALAGRLLELARQLAPLAAAQPPAQRADWLARTSALLPAVHDGPLRLEGALARIAAAWLATSSFATDVLFEPALARQTDLLVVVPGLRSEPLLQALSAHWGDKALTLALGAPAAADTVAVHLALDAEDEAERAAACVLRHLHEGRAPVALVAIDRLLVRRVNALLGSAGVHAATGLRDETGWKLSTTHAGACVLALLRAGAPRASSDEVLDWIKLAPAWAPLDHRRLEQRLRKHAVRNWQAAAALLPGDPLVQQMQALRAELLARRPLMQWLSDLRAALVRCGLWPWLQADAAGAGVIEALGLDDAALERWQAWAGARAPMSCAGFTRWTSEVLEQVNFQPAAAGAARVVVLPLAQLLGRSFPALVLAGADERHLPAAPEPPGPWSAAQRQALGLPAREDLQREQALAWALALSAAQVDVLHRRADESGEPVLASPLVQALRLTPGLHLQEGSDARIARALAPMPTARPRAVGRKLPMQPLSASSYEQLRSCPYRFFALRQLGLQDEGELDVDVDKRDWGIWVHALLRHFHEALQRDPATERLALMEAAAHEATRMLGLQGDRGEFLPFEVAWPPLRDAYLAWLQAHEAGGARFSAAEVDVRVQRGPLQLRGRIDRVDTLADGTVLLIDYKTEALGKTRARTKAGSEETQLPFYALLSDAEAPRAAYLNLAEREQPSLHDLPELQRLAAALQVGMARDMQRIAEGAPLSALGEGSVCDWCEVRGLCRKDFWHE
ncbi:PD-(D/E)XK nuclease family protein [Comamonas sp. NLF-1-9]|uniref:PD-(D/E)XK nuclease family protein n=1 Tax=Comamonas sp. NLF-1-9 TaxID=2853163 RepID=UPI001C47AEC9|nr:PD-(D/E)XK nuclease family protein [Comamonas sp. NLF-1-9]QXL83245.1 PD-(D/E)XK nuclease family protein [Comamonas sp. NLF-1-9]